MSQTFTSFAEFKRRYPIRPNDEGAMLGSGSYGRVIRVEDQVDTEWVAVKISEFKGNEMKSLKAEVELAQRVPRHSNIARYDACYRLETDTSVSDFAIMKYYPDGNLADLLRHESLTSAQIYDITKGILAGLQHLHQHHIVHRDFKPANILISRDSSGCFIPKIADFGLSKLVSDDELDGSDFDLSDGRGTPSYKAPEQIEGSKVSFNLDLWAFGVILFEIMTGEKPFRVDPRNTSEQSARREIEKKIITVELPDSIGQISEPYRTIIRRCLVRDIRERVRKEDELLDLLDQIPALVADAQTFYDRGRYDEALGVYEQVMAKRGNHTDAQRGIEQCKTAIEKQWIAVLLREAESMLESHQPKQAEHKYDEVLRLAPTNKLAIDGKTRCLGQLQSKPLIVLSEQTDVYGVEKTDSYEPIPAPVIRKDLPKPSASSSTAVAKPVVAKSTKPDKAPPRPTRFPSSVVSTVRPFPWRLAAPVAAGLGGLGLYFMLYGLPKPAISSDKTSTTASTASVVLPISSEESKAPDPTLPLPTPSTETKDVLDKRIDVALSKARRAYQQKEYEAVLMLTRSALLLDPSRRDVTALQNDAIDARIKMGEVKTAPASGSISSPPVDEAKDRKTETAKSETVKPSEPDAKEVAEATAKKEAQQQYDQLIEEGMKAVSGGNNKAKAINAFTEAEKLAKRSDLNTTKADAAYAYAMKKGDGYYDRATYDGAKDWYAVAQAAKNTKEVQKQLKFCTNQTQ